jgi:hypothetical protein
MTLTITRGANGFGDALSFSGSLTHDDLVRVNLDMVEFAILKECDLSSNGSDKLLALELVFRKLEQGENS